MNGEPIQAAEQAFQQGDLDRAAKICFGILAESPRHSQATLLSGLIAIQRGQLAAGIDLLRRSLDLKANDPVAMRALMAALIGASRYEEAAELGRTALSLWPSNLEILINLGFCCLALKDLRGAIGYLRTAVTVQPKDPSIRSNLGIAYELLGMYAEASEEYKALIALDPAGERGYVQLGRLLLAEMKYSQLLDLCGSAIKRVPGSAKLHFLYAKCLRELGNRALAEAHVTIAVGLEPEIAASVAFWLQEEGRFDKASDYLHQSIEQNPIQGLAYFGLLQGKTVGESDRALLSRMEELLSTPNLPPNERAYLHYGLGKGYDQLKQYEQAMRHFDDGNRLKQEIEPAARDFDIGKSWAEIRSVIDTFSASFFDRYRDTGSQSKTPIFIVGMPRTGTTLVEQIISSHPEVGAAGEQRFWSDEFWRVVDLKRGSLNSELFAESPARYLETLRLLQPQSVHITDKMPVNYRWLGLIHLAFPDAPIIHVRRNAADNALSIYMTAFEKPSAYTHVKENIVEVYRGYLALMNQWRTVIPKSRILEIRYEDLVENQELVTRQMIEFCGLEWDPSCIEFYSNDRSVGTPSMWQVRQPIYRRSVERWRNYEPWLGAFAELIPEG